MTEPVYKRILLKLSGEALTGSEGFGIDAEVLKSLAAEFSRIRDSGTQLAIVVGGGNLFRGSALSTYGIDRVTADQVGMLATVMNALTMQDALERCGIPTRVMSALKINQICEDYIRRRAIRHLEKGRVVIFAAGTGNPFFTTDSAASLRAIEIMADIMIKATKVDGIYSADPLKDPNATFYSRITYDRAISDRLAVMDTTAVVLCRDHHMPLRVMNINFPGALSRLLKGEDVGTLVVTE